MYVLTDGLLRPGSTARVTRQFLSFMAWALCAMCLFTITAPPAAHAQLAPGPYEILPLEDGCIVEGFKDLDLTTGVIADWTGWTTNFSGWLLISPHAYDNHTGTDFSVQTGTQLRAAAAGTVAAIETSYTRNQHANTHGNYVRIAVDTPAPNGELLDLTLRPHALGFCQRRPARQRRRPGRALRQHRPVGFGASAFHERTPRAGVATCPLLLGAFQVPDHVQFHRHAAGRSGGEGNRRQHANPLRPF